MTAFSFDVTTGISIRSLAPCDTISKIMGVEPNKYIKKGESQFQEKACENIWIYRVKHKNSFNLDICVDEFMESIPDLRKKVNEIKPYGECSLRISIVSLMAQIPFSISSYNLQRLSILDIPLDISVFSWGNVDG